ncbi:ATP-binding cassette domain-containing protein [Tessaracoccus sp. HDW20]|nr:ATP-binding cassette domain-containing protein [Tessaracoccus coleopterorum]
MVGGSGSGKTTLARLMLGLLRPSAGDVRFQGRSIIGLPERRRAGCGPRRRWCSRTRTRR